MKGFIFLFLSISTVLFSQEKIIFLISTPRSLSTGFLRMMEARRDFAIFHEPSIAPHDIVHYPQFYEETFRKDSFHSFEEAINAIFTKAQTSPVFVKDLSFACFGLLKESPLLQSAHFAFLVRKPQDTILSLYRRELPTNFIEDVAGYRQLYLLFELVKKQRKYPPYLFFSEDLGSYPSQTIALFCAHMGIDFKSEALEWEDLGDQFDGLAWNDGKTLEGMQHWHKDAIHSTGFLPLKTAEVDEAGIPTFSEIASPQDKEECIKIYFKILPYYEALQASYSGTLVQDLAFEHTPFPVDLAEINLQN